jgi:ATP-dependent exoDNAse (exonuclease V) beta subunit
MFPGAASAAWNREWRAHHSAQPALAGEAAWLHAADDERAARVLELLRRVRPLERGLSCAVLVPTNAQATEYAEYLRRVGGVPALAESDLRVGCDNPLGAAVLALIQSAAHPGDTLARGHLLMTPLGVVFARAGLNSPDAVSERILRQIHHDGFEETVASWVQQLEGSLAPEDHFSRERGRQLVEAAALFDATGSRDAAEFVAFIERHAVRGAEVAGVVRVMTIHKSKGLGFDVVLLPELEGQRLDQRREGLAVQRTAGREVEWVLDLPPKLFMEQDAVLRNHVQEAEAEGCYEALALLYVALTRAKRAMYVLTRAPRGSSSRNYPRLLAETLGTDPWQSGDRAWYEHLPVVAAGANRPETTAAEEPVTAPRAPRLPARRPSESPASAVPAEALVSLEAGGLRAADFGTAVHALLAAAGRSGAAGDAGGDAGAWPAEAVAEASACFGAPDLAEVWQRPERGEVWVERPFEIVLDGAWISGVFDRVVVNRGPDGAVERVAVYDFKTDKVQEEEALAAAMRRHAAQLQLYRRAAAVLTGMAAHAVQAGIVFTAIRRVVRVP